MLVQSTMVDMWTAEVEYRFPSDPNKGMSREDMQDIAHMEHIFQVQEDTARDLQTAIDNRDSAHDDL